MATTAPPAPGRWSSSRLSEGKFAALLALPVILILLAIVGYPTVYSLWMSLHDIDLIFGKTFPVGLLNYQEALSSPQFWHATAITIYYTALVTIFAVQLGWLPSCCAATPGLTRAEVTLGDRLRHLVLPALAVAVVGISPLILHTRARAVAFLESPAARHLMAHGARPLSVAFRQAARHAAGPALTVHLVGAGELIGGSVLAETVFAWPGLG